MEGHTENKLCQDIEGGTERNGDQGDWDNGQLTKPVYVENRQKATVSDWFKEILLQKDPLAEIFFSKRAYEE